MPEDERKTPPQIPEKHPQKKESGFKALFAKLRKRHIIETLAAFIAGGWLLVEVVERLLVGHYKFPEESIDLTVVSVIGVLLSALIWRWFRGTEKRPGNVKVEVLLVPLVVLATLAIDLNVVLQIAGIPSKELLIGIVALCLGISWVLLKLSQWASAMPESREKEKKILSPEAPRHKNSIVVLPFADMSPQKDQEYFCDGMTEEIITDLSHIHDLRVISRNSAMMLKGTPKDTTKIGRELNVQYVLEGSVRKAGNNLRITAQLIDAINDAHLWAEKYNGTLDDVFDIQEKVSRSIGNALKLKLTPEERQRIFARPIASPEAYDLHIMARHEIWHGTEQGLERALRLVKKGLDLIGDNEILYADLGFINIMSFEAGVGKNESVLVEAEEYVQKVFFLNPESAYGHYLRGMIQRKRRNPQQAVREFKKSLAIDPNHPDPLMWLGWVYAHSGRISEARHLVGKLLKIDPLNLLTYFLSGAVEAFDGKFQDGIKEFNKALQLDEQNPFIQFWVARNFSYAQLLGEAYDLSSRIEKEAPGTVWAGLASFHRYALENKKLEALQTAAADFRNMARDDESYPIWMAESYALIGEAGEAVEWIENAVNWGFINYPFLMEYDPFFANIRGEPRFQKLMERVKYEWEHFEV